MGLGTGIDLGPSLGPTVGPTVDPTMDPTDSPTYKLCCSFTRTCPTINLIMQMKSDTPCCQFLTRSEQITGYWGWSWLRSDWLSAGPGSGPEVGPKRGPKLLVDQKTFVGQCKYTNQ